MSRNRIEGAASDVAGKLEDAAGGLTGDAALQLKGKARQAAGKAQANYGVAIDKVRDLATDKPVGTVLVAAGVAFLAGIFWARRD